MRFTSIHLYVTIDFIPCLVQLSCSSQFVLLVKLLRNFVQSPTGSLTSPDFARAHFESLNMYELCYVSCIQCYTIYSIFLPVGCDTTLLAGQFSGPCGNQHVGQWASIWASNVDKDVARCFMVDSEQLIAD